jgi:TolA-binding protein
VAGNYPNSPKAPDALLKVGYSLAAMKEMDKANAIFESLIKSYPSSPAAAKARERLTAN